MAPSISFSKSNPFSEWIYSVALRSVQTDDAMRSPPTFHYFIFSFSFTRAALLNSSTVTYVLNVLPIVMKSRLFWYLVAASCISKSFLGSNADEDATTPVTALTEGESGKETQPGVETATVHEAAVPPSALNTSASLESASVPDSAVPLQEAAPQDASAAPVTQSNQESLITPGFPSNPYGSNQQQTLSQAMLSGACLDVSVATDATYCIPNRDICVGSGPLPISKECPQAGNVASMGCLPTLRSFNSQTGQCVLPVSAVCTHFESGTWGCAFEGYVSNGGYAMNQIPPPGQYSMPTVNGYPVESSPISGGTNGTDTKTESDSNISPSPADGESIKPFSNLQETATNLENNQQSNPQDSSTFNPANAAMSPQTGTPGPESTNKEEVTANEAGTKSNETKEAAPVADPTIAQPEKESEADNLGGKANDVPPSPKLNEEAQNGSAPQQFPLESYHNNC